MVTLKILLIDDSKTTQAYVRECFSNNKNIDLITADNGKIGLDVLKDEDDVDCIFLDWEMPVMNGIETLIEIKKKYPKITVMMLTVRNGALDIQKILSLGADEYIMKPFTRDILLEKLDKLMIKKGIK
ncbi:MAG: response regulator [Spirobacillus cienkowskii]|jgi:two-component system chemotaxis response regulator CheY|uniref:Response regulator n=1 Tax=Spirobacillus cienkowskii TaxID=495820 RepID=A0A369KUM3_9BACT|nr:MAG: response regulator [Spirobacillus cienkowskii]